MTLAQILDVLTAMLAAGTMLPEPAGGVARILAAAVKVAASLARDGRTTEEIVAQMHRARDIGPEAAAQDSDAARTVDERFPKGTVT